ncbi:hypothetical protein AWJ20_1520 [Sugiyamaella lignohabitans]|uniref:PH domain-containing protein n=1 Tax=Sugiyamaella lignohabitans TaxID=796027 RepID=A0A167DSG8_9ASCO|nr:uncharacterized protein AWJ20_1520 [Sugiyamaella lignohabitans]ANB13238.1 hypothetical protein AWJ20_1520 [Sugiyamaella lignohabitans]
MLDNRLNSLRPKFLEQLDLSDKYGFVRLGTKEEFLDLRHQFVHGSYIQLVSERSRPEAFIDRSAPEEFVLTDPGIVDIKTVKVGIIYRLEESSKLGLYSTKVWKEWGAILTASQLYLFKDVGWIKSVLIKQETASQTSAVDSHTLGTSIIRVPIDGFHPSVVVSTKNMVALTSYLSDRQKHSFFVGSGSSAETKDWFAAESKSEMNDWILKINYASSFNTYHIGIHGISNSHTDLKHRRHQSQPSGSSLTELANVTSNGRSSADVNDEKTFTTDTIDEATAVRADDDASLEVFASQKHRERVIAVKRKISKIVKVLAEKEKELEADVRTGRHLKLLAPIQPRTRESVTAAARLLIKRLDTSLINRKRLQCYHSLFELELQVETDFCMELGIDIDELDNDNGEEVDDVNLEAGTEDKIESPSESDKSGPEEESTDNADESRSEPEQAELGPVVEDGEGTTGDNKDVSKSTEELPTVELLPPTSTSTDGQARRSSDSSFIFQTVSADNDSISDSLEIISTIKKSTDSTSSVDKLKDKLTIPKRSRSSSPRREDKNNNNSEAPPAKESGNQRSVSLIRKTNDFTLLGKKFSVVEVNPEFAATPNHNRTTSQSVNYERSSSVGTSINELEPSPSLHSALSSLS